MFEEDFQAKLKKLINKCVITTDNINISDNDRFLLIFLATVKSTLISKFYITNNIQCNILWFLTLAMRFYTQKRRQDDRLVYLHKNLTPYSLLFTAPE